MRACSVTSPAITMTLATAPLESRTGAVEMLSSTGSPLARSSATRWAMTGSPDRMRARAASISACRSVGMCGRRRPMTSAAVQPKTASAAGFQRSTTPFASTS